MYVRFIFIIFSFLFSISTLIAADVCVEEKAKRCYLLRHGHTPWSWKMIPDGPKDLELSQEGREHIEKCARFFTKLAPEHRITTIFTSPLVRCRQTADIISAAVGGIPIQVVKDLEEMYHGDWSRDRQALVQSWVDDTIQRRLSDADAKREVFVKLGALDAPADAEPWEIFKVRAVRGIETCLADARLNNVLIIGHGMLYKAFLESRQLYNREDSYWSLVHRPPLIAEFNTLGTGWKMTKVVVEN